MNDSVTDCAIVTLEIIEGRHYGIFRRLGLHLRRKWPEADPKGTEGLITDPSILEDNHLHHELFLLLQERFGSLSLEVQQRYLSLVDQATGHPDLCMWQYRKLWPIQAFLTSSWRRRFEELRQKFGEIDHPSFLYDRSEMVRTVSPKSTDELRLMDLDALITFLRSWQPSGKWPPESPRELSDQLGQLVASGPERFAREAWRFKLPEPTYVRALVAGLRGAAKENRTFPWGPVLDLCAWVVSQQREMPGRDDPWVGLA